MRKRSLDPDRMGQFVETEHSPSIAAVRKQPTKWDLEARGIIRAEMKRRNFTYKQLALSLERLDEPETERNLINRVTRGTFTFSFALKCLRAMGATKVTIEAPE